MKKRRSLIISVLLVAALALGIGYAALTDVLEIDGRIQADAEAMSSTFEGLVYFDSAEVVNPTALPSYITAYATATSGSDIASYSIEGFQKVGDTVTMNFVIRNEYTETVWVTLRDHEAQDEFIFIENNYTGPIEIAGGQTATFTVTVTLRELSNEAIDLTHNIYFDVSDAAPNSETETGAQG